MMQNETVGAPATSAAAALKPRLAAAELQQQQQEEFPCPRCESSNTKFCYYNNYNLSQPRHFCKSCRRYWTRGGTLRDVPVGGGTRKSSKRPAVPAAPSNPSKRRLSAPKSSQAAVDPKAVDGAPDDRLLDAATGSFSSLLASAATNGEYGTLMDTLHLGDLNHPISWPELELQTANERRSGGGGGSGSEIIPLPPLPQTDSFLSLQGPEYSCWSGGWPDLSIYTPGLGFQ